MERESTVKIPSVIDSSSSLNKLRRGKVLNEPVMEKKDLGDGSFVSELLTLLTIEPTSVVRVI